VTDPKTGQQIDPVKVLPPLPGVAEHLDTTRWYADGSGKRFACDVVCTLCGLNAGARVMAHGEMSEMDRRFWAGHYESQHAEMLP
jgi:hypothetical protein